MVSFNIGNGNDFGEALAIQDDGKVIIPGYSVRETEYILAMARFDTNGNLDSTFGVDGMVRTDFNQREDYGTAITLQPDNKIILAGYSYALTGGSEVIVVGYDNVVLGTEDFQNVKFNLFPNLANSQITVQLSDASTSYKLEIYDVSGKKVYASEIQNTANINVSDFASGAYLVKLTSDSNSSVVRFVKQ